MEKNLKGLMENFVEILWRFMWENLIGFISKREVPTFRAVRGLYVTEIYVH